jgi:group I intron endonuclease
MEFRVPKDLKHRMGVYAILNNITGKVYIGKAFSFLDRFNLHYCLIRAGKHSNTVLQRSYDKYGGNNFHFELIELVENKGDLVSREQYYIDLFEAANRELGYNLRPKAEDNSGLKRSEASKNKVSRINGRKIFQLSREGDVINVYDSIRLAGIETGFDSSVIKAVCMGYKKSYKNFLWKYEDKPTKLGQSLKGKTVPEEVILRRLKTFGGKKVVQKTLDGNVVAVHDGLYFASKATGYTKTAICSVCSGHRKSLFGYVFKYIENE